MYFAIDEGVFEYDGLKINKLPLYRGNDLIQYSTSLSVDADNVVHVGWEDDFGYLYPDETGQLQYISLASQLPDSVSVASPIYKTYSIGERTYYCSESNVFITERDSLVKVVDLPEKSFFAYKANGDTLLVSRSDTTEYTLLYYDDQLHQTDLLSLYGGAYGMIPYNNGTYLIATGEHIYETALDGKHLTRDLVNHNKVLGTIILKHMPYGLVEDGEKIIMPTVMGEEFSIGIYDKNMNPLNGLSKKNGLGSNFAFSCHKNGHLLWVGMENCIAKVETDNVFHHFSNESGLSGCINKIIQYDGDMYVAAGYTFREEFDNDGFPYFTSLNRFATYDLLVFNVPNSHKKILLAGTANNTIDVKKAEEATKKTEETGKKTEDNGEVVHIGSKVLFQSRLHPEFLYIGTKESLLCYEYRKYGSKHWNQVYEAMLGAEVFSINEDQSGNIWCVTTKSIFKLSPDGKSFNVYDEENGIPSISMTTVKNIDNRLLFLTMAGIYEFDENESVFELSDIFGEFSTDTTFGTIDIKPYRDMYVASCYLDDSFWLNLYKKNADGKYTIVNDNAFKKLESMQNGSIYYTYVDDEDHLWFSLDESLVCYSPENVDSANAYYNAPFDAMIRQVMANDTVPLFNGAFKAENGFGVALMQPKNNIIELPYSNNSLTFFFSSNFYDGEKDTEYSTMLVGEDENWSKWRKSTEYNRIHLGEGKYVFKVKARNIYGVESSVAEFAFTIKPPFYRTIVAYLVYLILLIAFVYGIVKWNTHRLIEEKKKLEKKIADATEEIRGQNVQLEQQKDEIEKQKDEIQSSINYARRIQRALLTPDETIDKIFPDHFLLYKPRNVVSGDYYWFGQFGDNKVSIVADCTGHGVPGGFMSMLGMTNLNYIVGQELRPDEILNKLRNAIITSLRQKDDSIQPTGDEKADRRAAFAMATEKKDRSQDGMDVAMYVINEKEMTLSFAGANNPLVLIRDGEVQVIKASKMPVGIYAKLDPFERVDMELKKGDCLYTFSDGFQDQFGFESGKKFMSKHLREVLLEIHQKPMPEQKEILNKIYEDWRGPADHQTDDVVLMGVRI